MQRTPRQAFTTGPYREAMEKIALTEAFLAGCDAALLTLGEELSNPNDLTAQAQLVGARRFCEILKSIHEKLEPKKPLKTPALNYDVPNLR